MLVPLIFLAPLVIVADTGSTAVRPCQISVVDDETGRGVPLVELRTVHEVSFWTDSRGVAAIDDPDLLGRKVFFTISSHGYEFPADGFGYRGKALAIEPGSEVRLEIHRINLAERLYRVTGAGIYRDSVILKQPVPLRQPVIASGVAGCDSVLTAIYQGRLFWVWGDTNRTEYPLGNFDVTGATSQLPGNGGLAPDVGIDFDYFSDDRGFVRRLAKMPGSGPTWIDSLTVLANDSGAESLYASYVKIKPPLTVYARGIAVFDDQQREFRKLSDFPHEGPLAPRGHTFARRNAAGEDHIYFSAPYPLVRVRASVKALIDPEQYEAYTCLEDGTTVEQGRVDRDSEGRVRYAWRFKTPAVGPSEQASLVASGKLTAHEGLLQLRDLERGAPVLAHAGSVYWNPWRCRWVMITTQIQGTSMLGEIWYAEADTPQGPWAYAVKVVSHQQYSFYNPKHHPFFDQDDGRILYFEGTYTATFSGNPRPTPRYEYNQIMYRLDLGRSQLVLPVPLYVDPKERCRVRRSAAAKDDPDVGSIACFVLDRPTADSQPLYLDRSSDPPRLTLTAPSMQAAPQFFIYRSDAAHRPAVSEPLTERRRADGSWDYLVGNRRLGDGEKLDDEARGTVLGYVWPNPWRGP